MALTSSVAEEGPDNGEKIATPFVVGVEWFLSGFAATALVVADLKKCQKLTQAARLLPELGVGALAGAMISRSVVIRRVSEAAEREAREEIERLKSSTPEKWRQDDPSARASAFADLREQAEEKWRRAWAGVEEWPLRAGVEGWRSREDLTMLRLSRGVAPAAAGAGVDIPMAFARGAEQELRAVAAELFGDPALIFSRVVSPQEHRQGDLDLDGLVVAQIESQALRSAADTAQATSGSESQRTPSPPRKIRAL